MSNSSRSAEKIGAVDDCQKVLIQDAYVRKSDGGPLKVLLGRADADYKRGRRLKSVKVEEFDSRLRHGRRWYESVRQYGYKRITALLRADGWHVNHKRVARIWRREGLKVPLKQPKRGRLWLNDGSCVRLRPQYRGHVWAYDFVENHTHDGRKFRMLTVIDEFSRECLAIVTERRLNSRVVLDTLADLFLIHGPPEHIRSDNVLRKQGEQKAG